MAQLIISAVGPDRPGIVGELSGHLHHLGGNILDSRMVNLRGQFVMMILVEIPDDTSASIARDLPSKAESMGLRVFIDQQPAITHPQPGLRYRLKTYSMDQPGIVARLTNMLREHGVNIEELAAHQESAAFAGSALFVTEMSLTIPPTAELRRLRTDLQAVCNQLNCDVDLEPETD
jgi:glycine cleavage system transcriptional repressor